MFNPISFDNELGAAPKHALVGRHPLLPGINIAVKGAKAILPSVTVGYAEPMRRRGKVVPGAYVPAIGVRDETWVQGYWVAYTPAKGGYGVKPFTGMGMRYPLLVEPQVIAVGEPPVVAQICLVQGTQVGFDIHHRRPIEQVQRAGVNPIPFDPTNLGQGEPKRAGTVG